MPTPKKKSTYKGINVGDFVHVQYGAKRIRGKVIEDRGKIGHNGRRLFRIQVNLASKSPFDIELPAQEIVGIPQRPKTTKKGSGKKLGVGKIVATTAKAKKIAEV